MRIEGRFMFTDGKVAEIETIPPTDLSVGDVVLVPIEIKDISRCQFLGRTKLSRHLVRLFNEEAVARCEDEGKEFNWEEWAEKTPSCDRCIQHKNCKGTMGIPNSEGCNYIFVRHTPKLAEIEPLPIAKSFDRDSGMYSNQVKLILKINKIIERINDA